MMQHSLQWIVVEGKMLTEIVRADAAHSAWVCPPDFSEMYVADLVLTWLSQAAPVADTYHGFML